MFVGKKILKEKHWDMSESFLLKYTQTIETWRSNEQAEKEEFSHIKNEIFLDHAANAVYMASSN